MVVHNPNNWHWIDKNCLPWSKDYLKTNIVSTSYEDEQYRFEITSVDTVSGDCDVTQRKGKVLCIYDMKLQFLFSGNVKDGDDKVTGTIVIPEFVHDQDEDE
ncbi:Hsp90 co-chaperone AHA1 [Candida viswanathii]|uniref:Hsp90 co-chaperone AHA1 n=1 Tax=Candida viswanathii TaxID=5486 RepID=A0A367XUI8_9ASCO|nr:Hsp90 co-chaperone AHA1 [Candida viswanathii]